MTFSSVVRNLAKSSLICALSLLLACAHRAVISSVPRPSVSTNLPAPAEVADLQPDQVNTDGWNKAWTNLLNDAEQSFTPALPILRAVEVELVVGNPGASEDELTLTLLDVNGRSLAVVGQDVPTAESDHVIFIFPNDGVKLSPGESYRLKLSGGATFGWKYVVGGYENGEATFNGKPLLRDARSTFLFRTFGDN
jgi:hypothetical protein